MHFFNLIRLNSIKTVKNVNPRLLKRYLSSIATGCSHLQDRELTNEMKLEIENHWRNKLTFKKFDSDNFNDKFYVLSMFPYPSGNLHMGHVRVYTISDAMARFYRLNGKNVLHPMGFDAFGLPAENAAIQRKIPADIWTHKNIATMKEQLISLGCSFDWDREFATCNPEYYKWTQKLFLMLYNDGLVYQKESLVNWDPVDCTVLADEQVDANGCSWRSGAKVEKKLLKQWFVKTTKFAKKLFDGLDDPSLVDWKDIIKLQKHWIGECDGYNFDLSATDKSNRQLTVTVWTKNPEHLKYAAFIAVRKDHLLNLQKMDTGLLDFQVLNPVTKCNLPVVVVDNESFQQFQDSFLGVPTISESDKEIATQFNIPFAQEFSNDAMSDRNEVLDICKNLKLGGDYFVSQKLKDWLISRQRYWGTPIPIIHCDNCGTVAVPEENLPVRLPDLDGNIGQPLSQNADWLKCECPKCGSPNARRESDTMDTFVDSSWYFLRYLDPKNDNEIFDTKLGKNLMPVDLYIGGKEHAVLHLYYARFINHYLHHKGFLAQPEPFTRLLVQGMVMGRSFKIKGSGKYLKEDEVEIIDAKKNKAIEKSTGNPVTVMWEKMSKSKLNGVDPIEVIGTYGCDTTRLIMLADVAPTSSRNWSNATFPGILNWQRRIWMTLHDMNQIRQDVSLHEKSTEFDEHESKLLDSKNYFVSGTTFNYLYSHQLSVAISKMQGLTNSIRRAPKDVIAFGKNFESALAAQIIMISPMAPHFASELWTRFVNLPNRANVTSNEINWDGNVFEQKWPTVDENYPLELTFKISNYQLKSIKIPHKDLNQLTEESALNYALNDDAVLEYINQRKIIKSNFTLYPGCEAIINITIEKQGKLEKEKSVQ